MIKVFYWGLRTATFALPYVEQAFFNWNIGLEKKNSVISGEGSWLTKKKHTGVFFPGDKPESGKCTSGSFNLGSLEPHSNIN